MHSIENIQKTENRKHRKHAIKKYSIGITWNILIMYSKKR